MTAKIVYNGELRTTATHLRSGTRIETDAPPDNQGLGERFSPTDLVAAALGSCMLTVMGIAARKRSLPLDHTQVSVEKIMGVAPRRITEIRATVVFPEGHGIAESERSFLEDLARNCPVAKSIHPDIVQDIRFQW